ncbi:MAG: glycosyltransferase family 4 protein [Gammaproteobacteria bacterium]|nr:glycosyltransferase family 4 protein [Gammaproteobacteria bacterium]
MRILFCDYEYPPLGGGGGVFNLLMAEELAKHHDVTVLTSQAPGYPKEVMENGVRVIRVPIMGRTQQAAASLVSMFAYIPMAIKEGKKLLAREKFDVINTYFVLPTGPAGDALSRASGLPNVLTVLGGDIYDPSKATSPHRNFLLRAWVRKLLRNADSVTGESENILKYMRQFYTPEIPGELIPLGIKRPTEGTASREQYGFSESDTLFVSVGRLVSRKAADQLIAMIKAHEDSSVHLLLIGDGPQQQFLLDKARELGIEGQIHFMGRVDEEDKFRLLRMSDIFASSSQHEGFGLVFIEAMACGLPVVCYNEGGQTDFLQDNVTGYVVPLNDRTRFIKGCITLTNDKALRSKTGEENLRRAEEGYFIDHSAKSYEVLFEEVIRKHKDKA